jgi:serine/threonine-protein kinase
MAAPGSSVAGYRLVRRVGEGGMGVVFLAEDPEGRHVALKLLKPEKAADESAIRDFENEAEATAAVDHENVVTILDRGSSDGFHYIVMEYVDGPPLHLLLGRKGRLPWKDAAEITVQVARALQCAHALGYIHRDVKPENVLLFRDGRARLTDFGIVKDIGSLRGFLIKGEQVGTAAYASPEQCLSKRLTAATDVYSLGATLYHMLCGRPPFTGDSNNVVMNKHVKTAPIPPIRLCPDVPKALSNAVLRMLDKSPTRRYLSMAPLIEELEQILEGRVAIPRGAGRSSRGSRPTARRRKRAPEPAEEKVPISGQAILVTALLAIAAVLAVLALAT